MNGNQSERVDVGPGSLGHVVPVRHELKVIHTVRKCAILIVAIAIDAVEACP